MKIRSQALDRMRSIRDGGRPSFAAPCGFRRVDAMRARVRSVRLRGFLHEGDVMANALWDRFKSQYFADEGLGFSIDVSRMDIDDAFIAANDAAAKKALDEMKKLEAGAIANPDEKRMVGHYWLRTATPAPQASIRAEVEDTLRAIHRCAADVHEGKVRPEKGGKFKYVLVVGIGGSALGPQFVADALGKGEAGDRMKPFFFDNTDPDGIDRV